jgi:Zc3h12a-like Ribonuclease NYN domain/S1 RNA binding domain
MQAAMKVKHVVVDGSNIATEGRDAPSLAQLDEAVRAFVEEYSPTYVTVVVDATFPNRIDRKERRTYEDAVNANELVTPPAGAIGRGDAFILQIARRADAAILSNDSFQEFHGDYPWLFEKGRLIGGKPVPHVGWVFMDRAPVRGPTSRRSVSEARKSETRKVTKAAKAAATESVAESAAPEPAPQSPAPRKRRARAKAAEPAPEVVAPAAVDEAEEPPASGDGGGAAAGGRAAKGVEPYNEALPFIEFVSRHPVGSEVDAEIERFSSHGAYVLVGAARAYVPLRNLAHPAPRSAKEVLRVGDSRRFVVVAVDPPRRGIDLALPGVVEVTPAPGDEVGVEVLAGTDGETPETAAEAAPAEKVAGRKPAAGRKSAAGKATADEVAAKPGTKRSPAKRSPSTKVPAGKAATGEAASEPVTAADDTRGEAPAKRARGAKKATAGKATAGRSARARKAAPAEEQVSAAGKAPGTRKASGTSKASGTKTASGAGKASRTRKASETKTAPGATVARKASGVGKATTARKASGAGKGTAARKALGESRAARKAAGTRTSARRKSTAAKDGPADGTGAGGSPVPEVITLARGGDDGVTQPDRLSEAAGG